MKERNKLIIAIVAVLAIIAVVGGATFAYWTWVTSDDEKTAVTFTIKESDLAGQLSATLNGGATSTFSGLIPVSSCTASGMSAYVIKKPLTLKYKNLTSNAAYVTATLKVGNFTSPHGTPNTTSHLNHLHYALTKSATSCTTSAVKSGTFNTTNGALFSNATILDNIAAGTAETSQNYWLWVWIDGSYTHQNVGSGVVNDPMQDISFTLTWTGQISNDVQ